MLQYGVWRRLVQHYRVSKENLPRRLEFVAAFFYSCLGFSTPGIGNSHHARGVATGITLGSDVGFSLVEARLYGISVRVVV